MFDLLIFTQYPVAYAPKRLKEEALKIDLNCKIKSYKYTNLNELPEAKFVILREPTASKNIYKFRDNILNYYLSKNTNVLNSESYLKWSILDKQTQTEEFEIASIPHIKPLEQDNISYPYIVKAKLGSHGSHVFKIENEGDLISVFEKGYKKEDLLFQEFQNSGFDLRVIVLNEGVLGIMKRTPKTGEFLSNYSQGGTVTKYVGDDEEQIKEIATKTAKHFKLDYVGVDLMVGNDDEWKVLEVNRACQFQGFERATGVNVASVAIDFIKNRH